MLSRVAETLYWMARYIERTENVARLINVNNMLMMDLPKGVYSGWEPLIDIIGVNDEFNKTNEDMSERSILRYLLVGDKNSSSILKSIAAARENARTIRDVLPKSVWECINSLYYYVKDNQNEGLSKRGRFNYLKHIIESSQMIFGALDGSINHDHGYVFIRFGAVLERADMTSRILDVRSASLITSEGAKPYENIQWISLLRSLSAYQMYRQEMGVRVQSKDVIEFLLHSAVFPRSVLFCLSTLKELLQKVNDAQPVIAVIDASIDNLYESEVRHLKNSALHDYIDHLQVRFANIHNELAEVYFLK